MIKRKMLDILKIIFCLPFLMYSCYSDIRTRRVTNRLWVVMLTGGIFFILYDFSFYGIYYLFSLFFSVGLIFVIIMLCERLSELFHIRGIGGADAKLLLVLSVLFPFYPSFEFLGHDLPRTSPLSFFGLSVLGNAVIVAMTIPIAFAIYNLMKMGLHIDKLLYIFFGYKTKISELDGKKVWICQDFEEINGKIKVYYTRHGRENDEKTIKKLKNLLKRGLIKDEIWVTPKIPFMIPITIGFFIAILYGDLIFELTKTFIK